MPSNPVLVTASEVPERWDDHLRVRDGESNEAYWLRQAEWTDREAAKILAWCAKAQSVGEVPNG